MVGGWVVEHVRRQGDKKVERRGESMDFGQETVLVSETALGLNRPIKRIHWLR